MLQTEKALKVSIHVNEGATYHGASASASILDFLFYRGVSDATVLKGVAGFGADHHLHTAASVELSDRLPVKVEFIETPEKVEELMGKLQELAGSGMIEIQETTIARGGSLAVPAQKPPLSRKLEGKAKMLRIYVEEGDTWNDKPLHEALVEALQAHEMAGVTVYRSILGYGSTGELHRHGRFTDHGPLMLSTIDTEERVNAFLTVLDKMMSHGLAVVSDVDVIHYQPIEKEGNKK